MVLISYINYECVTKYIVDLEAKNMGAIVRA